MIPRIGLGFDVHRFITNRPLVLGGVTIPHSHGLDGHSDADVLLHAIMDALLGAAGLPDIGHYFPNTDAQYKNVSSVSLLTDVAKVLHERSYQIGNIDASLIAEAPKIGPYVEEMRACIAKALQIETTAIGIKATTNEQLGSLGRGEGMAAMAVALLVEQS